MGHPVDKNRAVVDRVMKPLKDGRQILIRGAILQDIPQLGRIYAGVYSHLDVGEAWTPETASQTLEDLYKKNPALALVAEVNGTIVGGNFCDVKKWLGKEVVDAKEIFVNPQFQHLGIGAQLMMEGFNRAKVFYNAQEVELITFANAGHARKWYEELGIEPSSDLILMHGDLEKVLPQLRTKILEMA